MKKHLNRIALFFVIFLTLSDLYGQQHSVARKWNEVLLTAIRNDFARPTVHARNLFHISAAMYDAWAIYDDVAETYLIANERNGVEVPLDLFEPLQNRSIQEQQEEAMSYVAYRMIAHRFQAAPGGDVILQELEDLFRELGYSASIETEDYTTTSSPAAVGNYIAARYIEYGLQDGSNEEEGYNNTFYSPVNEALEPDKPGNPTITDLDRWQPLALVRFIDQSGNEVAASTAFLSPEWGNVWPFAMTDDHKMEFERDGETFQVYQDPGAPPYISDPETAAQYKWGFELVSIWGAHLDPADGVMWDISPASIGNTTSLPETFADFPDFFNEFDGGDGSPGRDLNPVTGEPYPPNMVPRGDYARVLAEFWADGPDSETPPGHWFTILNYVHDHEQFRRQLEGEGDFIPVLEWDVKAYFMLGGVMHDAAIAAWSVKGYYDYIRPISAIRAMADLGQSSDENLPNYHENGIELKEGFIELVEEGDALAGNGNEHVGKIKLYSWKGPDFIEDPETDVAGVGWILAENWWPYQRPTFVTPPFAGYVSGHSTYSRAAAEAITLLTGSEYFPGGVGEFVAKKNEFLVFEDGPSVDVVLQWATYRDASDQTSLSRIWGGIHPPADDIPGRKMGIEIGIRAYDFAKRIFAPDLVTGIDDDLFEPTLTYGPNPVERGEPFEIALGQLQMTEAAVRDLNGNEVNAKFAMDGEKLVVSTSNLPEGLYLVSLRGKDWAKTLKVLVRN